MLEAVKPVDPIVPFEQRLAMGDPAAEICRIAADEGAKLIVLGTHGRGGLLRLLMGSVAESILRRAPCPVLVYREPGRRGADRPATAGV
jgi:nucleotide-binding universal stress UspA family protein